MWIVMSILSAFFGGINSILAKCGIKETDSDVATGIRTIIVLLFSFIIVLITGSINSIKFVSLNDYIFLILSGITTGFSWIFYFKALSIGDVNKVVAIDKLSVVLSIIFAIVLFNETNNILIKLFGIISILIGTIFMIEMKSSMNNFKKQTGIIYAFLSAIFASLTSILARFGINDIDSNLGTFIRTIIVLIISWIIIFNGRKQKEIHKVNRREFLFICLSGVATGCSWLCYYYAIKHGIVSVVIPIDKLSILVSILFSFIVFKERLTKKSLLGLSLIIVGTFVMTIFF